MILSNTSLGIPSSTGRMRFEQPAMSRLLWLVCLIGFTVYLVRPVDAYNGPRFECDTGRDGCYCLELNGGGSGSILRGSPHVRCCCFGSSVKSIPRNLTLQVQTLILRQVGLQAIQPNDFTRYFMLETVVILYAPDLSNVSAEAFAHLPNLKKLSIYGCGKMTEITGTLLHMNPDIKFLHIRNTGLTKFPQLEMVHSNSTKPKRRTMMDIIISGNHFSTIPTGFVKSVSTVLLDLTNNDLTTIEAAAFNDSQVGTLILSHNNNLERIDQHAFAGIKSIHTLDVSYTAISVLPEDGLSHINTLRTVGAQQLKKLPSIFIFEALQVAVMEYPYHCCLFQKAKDQYAIDSKTLKAAQKTRKKLRQKYCHNGEKAASTNDIKQNRVRRVFICDEEELFDYYRNITCTPRPDALNPCEDVMGYESLRYLIWLVWISAMVANLGVIVVLLLVNHTRMRVHNFFMANLAVADLSIGAYLAMLAVEDAITKGSYYNYAVDWQTGVGCQVAGFLCVFGSELSVISMFLVSFEIWYNTKYIFYGRRLTLKMAVGLMSVGWLYATAMAVMPLVGISSYSSTSTCLPLEMDSHVEKAFFGLALGVMILAFAGITANYVSIYCSVAGNGSPSTLRNEDLQVAKKMLLLIGTDFICWAPTVFFGLTAALDHPLISISASKVLLVVFFPINSLLNPFLYVFLTKTIRQDMYLLARKHFPWLTGRIMRRGRKPRAHSDPWYATKPPGAGGDVEQQRKTSSSQQRRIAYQRLPTGGSTITSHQGMTMTTSLGSSPRNSNVSSLGAINTGGVAFGLSSPYGEPPLTPRSRNVSGPAAFFSEDNDEQSKAWTGPSASFPQMEDSNVRSGQLGQKHVLPPLVARRLKPRSMSLEEPGSPIDCVAPVSLEEAREPLVNATAKKAIQEAIAQCEAVKTSDKTTDDGDDPSPTGLSATLGSVWPFSLARRKLSGPNTVAVATGGGPSGSGSVKKATKFQPRMSDISEHSHSETSTSNEEAAAEKDASSSVASPSVMRKVSAPRGTTSVERLQRISEHDTTTTGGAGGWNDGRRESLTSKASTLTGKSSSLSDISDRFGGSIETTSSNSSKAMSKSGHSGTLPAPHQLNNTSLESQKRSSLSNQSSESGYPTSLNSTPDLSIQNCHFDFKPYRRTQQLHRNNKNKRSHDDFDEETCF